MSRVLVMWMMFTIAVVFMTFAFVLLIIDFSNSYGTDNIGALPEKVNQNKVHDVIKLLKVVKSIMMILITLFLN